MFVFFSYRKPYLIAFHSFDMIYLRLICVKFVKINYWPKFIGFCGEQTYKT